MKAILVNYTGGTYVAKVHEATKFRASCTAGAEAAAKACVTKWYGEEKAETTRKVTDREELQQIFKVDHLAILKAPGRSVFFFDENAPKKELALLPPEDVAVCNALHESATNHAEKARQEAEIACHYAVVLGLRLQALRAKCPHGGWTGMFAGTKGKDTKGVTVTPFAFSYETASRYIRAAEGALDRPGLGVAAKKRLLALAHSPTQELSEEHHADLDQATRGETLRQLYFDLGVLKGAATEKTPQGRPGERPKGLTGNALLAEDIYEMILEPFRKLALYVERGDLALLTSRQLEDVESMCRGILDVTKKINREDG